MKKLRVFFLAVLVASILALAASAPSRVHGKFMLPEGFCKICLKQWDRV